ncbi:MAG: histidine--tRNA ligase [Actinobacteria bacterium]|nr:histidine--tRNA ligase [Actinomycetota bacterium]
MTQYQAPKGVSEYFPPRSLAFEWVRETLVAPAKLAGYNLLELPIFEDTELFTRGVGASTDVVSKEMYTFEDRGGRSITLRPEGTVGALRAIIEHNLDRASLPVKIWYAGAFFRAERPQAGRYRQFYSVGIEAVGSDDPALDAEVISIAYEGFKNLGLKKFRLEITSLGDRQSRAAHRIDLLKYISTLDLDESTKERVKLNPLRIFDDKRPQVRLQMQDAPKLLDYLSDESRVHFETVQKYLQALHIEFEINPRMVRGLDYYTGTTFEFVHDLLGAQSGIGGGGRYDGLMEEIGGQPLTGIGFGLGIDRALLAVEAEGLQPSTPIHSDLYLIALGEMAKVQALITAQNVKSEGISVEIAFGEKVLKNAMKRADKNGAPFVVILGDSELSTGSVELKEMKTGTTFSVTLSSLPQALRQALDGR